MHLSQVQLRNWRSYRNATFELPSPDRAGKRNVILIGAQNGVGKTSFLMALYLGLFGREAMDLIEGFRRRRVSEDGLKSYERLIESVLHRPARSEEEPHCFVRLTFGAGDDTCAITRRWHFRGGGRVRDLASRDGEEVLVEVGGKKKLFDSWQDANARIQELIFPVNVMPCLFFDGEQAQERVEAAGGAALFDAVKTLYGTGILDQLSESLRSYIGNERAALQRDVGTVRMGELDNKRQELDAKKDELAKVQRDLTDGKTERAAIENERQQLEERLYSMVGDSAADVEEYGRAVAALQSEEAQVRQELVIGIGSLALPLALSRSSARISSILRGERERERWLLLKDEASGKAASIVENVLPLVRPPQVEPPLTIEQTHQLRSKLEKALEALWSPPPDGCAERFTFVFLGESERMAALAKLAKAETHSAPNITVAATQLQQVQAKLVETRKRFDRVRELQPQLQELKAQLQSVLDRQREVGAQIATLEHRERGLTQAISDLRGAIGQMEKRRDAQSPVQEKLDVAGRVRTLIDDAKEQLVPLCKEALEERCTEHFRAMISKEYGSFNARFEVNSEPWLEGPSGQQVFVSSLSGAQKRAFGLAFTLAVADVSHQEAPIVVDTPVGNMDSAYRGRVLSYVAQAASGQVIFLSHDEERESSPSHPRNR